MNGERPRRLGIVIRIVVMMGIASSVASADPGDAPSRWYFRLGLLRGAPNLDSVAVTVRALPGVTLRGGTVPQGNATVEPLTLLAGPIGLVLPGLNNRLSLETIIGIPRPIKVVASGTLATESILPSVFGVPTGIPPLGRDLAEVNATALLLTGVYRIPSIGPVTPILGAGFVALLGFDIRFLSPVLKQYLSVEVEAPPSLAPIAQAGVEIRLWHRLQARIEVKYVSLSPQFTLKHIQLKTEDLIGTVDLGDVDIRGSGHIWLMHAGVGFDL